MRKSLRQLLRFEMDPTYVKPAHPFNFKTDVTAMQAKLKQIRNRLEAFVGSNSSSEFLKLSTKVARTTNRINRVSISDATEAKEKYDMLITLLQYVSGLEMNAKEFKQNSTATRTIIDISVINLGTHE